ncbi:MAG: GDSL family lipase [Lachnospiraceae bacterium]|nr:GDSL family lipase [Lachnospiraceae bacterium]
MEEIRLSGSEKVRLLGRNGVKRLADGSVDPEGGVALFWTGSGFTVQGRFTELWVELEADFETYEPWISWTLNGAVMGRMMVPKGRHRIPLARNLNPEKVNTIRLQKDVQAMAGEPKHILILLGISVEGTLEELPEPQFQIEFVGDSITSGEGSIGAVSEMDWISMFFSAFNNYAVMTGDLMEGAEIRIVSQSGYGTYVSFDNRPDHVVPAFYTRICGVADGELQKAYGSQEEYDFSSWQPDAVVINLGTNDAAAFDFDPYTDPETGRTWKMKRLPDGSHDPECDRLFEEAVYSFLKTVREKNSKARILWVTGMLGTEMLPAIKRAHERYMAESGDRNTEVLVLPEAAGESIGARSHPGRLCHKAAAEYLADYFHKKF